MQEIIQDVDQWLHAQDEPIAIATVVQTWGSAPRKTGAKMGILPSGGMSGSVSGGCVEGAVFAEAVGTIETKTAKLLHFGVADETAWEVGLACGGIIEIFVEPLNRELYAFHHNLLTQNEAGAVVTIIQGSAEQLGQKMGFSRSGKRVGSLGADLDALAIAAEEKVQRPSRLQLTAEVEVFIDTVRPAPTLIIVGGVHIAIPLIHYAQQVGFKTTIIDPRRAFGSEERFPHVDKLIQAWPQKAFADISISRETAVALLTHDPKIDDPALEAILDSPAFYIGALGSKKTHSKRIARLQEKGVSAAQINQIHAPIGLNIHAQTPAEIALAVMAEIINAYRS